MTRFATVIVAVLIAAAAPARAWCEASCLATSAHASPHCPTHEPEQNGAAVSANDSADCPILESARPTVVARLDLAATGVAIFIPQPAARLATVASRTSLASGASIHQRHTPLRI